MSTRQNGQTSRPGNETRERIVAAARTLAGTSNFNEFTLNQIADMLGLHYTAVYHYFKNRDDLQLHLIKQSSARRSEHLSAARGQPGTAADHLQAFVSMEMHEDPMALMIRGRSTLSGPYRSGAIAAYQQNRTELSELVQQGMAEGSLRTMDAELAAHVISRILDRYASYNETVFAEANLDAESLGEAINEFFSIGLLPEQAGCRPFEAHPKRTFRALRTTKLDQILIRTTASFNTRGWRGTSIPEVARELGMSKTAFYRFAATKEELLFLCATRTLNLLAQVRQSAISLADDPLEALLLDTLFLRQLLTSEPGPLLSPFLFDSLSEQRGRAAQDQFLAYRLELVDLLSQCVDQGLTRPLDPLAVQPMITACAYIPLQSDDVAAGYSDEVIQFMLRGIRNREA